MTSTNRPQSWGLSRWKGQGVPEARQDGIKVCPSGHVEDSPSRVAPYSCDLGWIRSTCRVDEYDPGPNGASGLWTCLDVILGCHRTILRNVE